MPGLPKSARQSLHRAIGYVAEQCKCDLTEAGEAVLAALGEEALVASAQVLERWIRASMGNPGAYRDLGVQAVPATLWAKYPWPWFEARAAHPRGNPQYREQTAERKSIGPVYADPTLATADIDRWLGVEVVVGSVTPTPPAQRERPRRRGPKPRKLQAVVDRMRLEITEGTLTPEKLNQALEKELAGRYAVSRDTARKARNHVLSSDAIQSNSRQFGANDK